jgi:hypothetical protein
VEILARIGEENNKTLNEEKRREIRKERIEEDK